MSREYKIQNQECAYFVTCTANGERIMKSKKNMRYLYFAIILFFFFSNCNKRDYTPSPSIEGIWSGQTVDSTYLEIIISPEEMYSEEGNKGNLLIVSKMLFAYTNFDVLSHGLNSCKYRNDSLIIYENTNQSGAFQVKWINENGVFLKGQDMGFHLTQLSDKILANILMVDTLRWENYHFKRYLKGFHERRNKFEIQRQ
jgi:hypothetical protein